jgi:Protein of unknown function (DUF2721)
MADDTVIKTINLIIAPVVMITACGIMLNGLIVRYSWLSDRVRSVHQEQLNLLELDLNQNKSRGERLHQLDHLLPDFLRHHHQVHDVLVLIYLSILVFMLDMLVIALAVANDARWLSQLVVVVFLLGISILLWGMILISYELRTSHHSIQLEVHESCLLCKKPNRDRKKF